MRNLDFHKYVLRRQLNTQGTTYTFYREGKNDLGEPNNSTQEVVSLVGLWHETQSYIRTVSGDAATVRSKPQSQILTLWDSAVGIQQGDYLLIDNTRYEVTGVHDPTNLRVAADISLEVVV